ncbi:unnamed protein product [Adineta ricciae]|uniref:Cell division cycle protein 123 homolog n=2 Tax=Adineta ricciae TaxID=249248 RepID=A0A814R0L1_ADIRI|nr:unnamed protein product [Adineta ricciae]
MNDNSTAAVKISSNQTTHNSGESYDEQLLKRSKNVNFDVEAWYKIIKSETFHTKLLPVSPSLAQAFVNFYQTRFMLKTSLTLHDVELIQSMRHQLKEQIFNSNHTSFIRLSARSPKDGKPLDSGKIGEFYQEKLSELQAKYPNEYQTTKGKANIQTIALYYAQFHSLKVTNEDQALNLIFTSERIYHDLIEILDCHEVKENQVENVNHTKVFDWDNHLIIRQWNDDLDPSMEFRCFVHQSNLTAISQYNYLCKQYHLQDENTVKCIKATIENYWRTRIQPLFDPYSDRYSNYVIDIGLIENKTTNRYDCIVIELNPFERTTHPSLFDWIKDADQLKGETNQLEIRVQTDYYPYIEDYIEFLLEVNHCIRVNEGSSDRPDTKPYFMFLDQIKTQLSS